MFHLRAQEFSKAVSLIQAAIEAVPQPAPDMWRNLGWASYLVAEDFLHGRKPDYAFEPLMPAKKAYEEAEHGFLKMYESEQDEDRKKMIGRRVTDCRRRLIHVEGFMEYVGRRRKLVTGENLEKVETPRQPAAKIPPPQERQEAQASEETSKAESGTAEEHDASGRNLSEHVQQIVGRLSGWLHPKS